jgi:hypothetical protein
MRDTHTARIQTLAGAVGQASIPLQGITSDFDPLLDLIGDARYYCDLPTQFDAIIHFDETRALEPLERAAGWEAGEPGEVPETYPSGV